MAIAFGSTAVMLKGPQPNHSLKRPHHSLRD